jgi:hypothetical protein
MKIKLFGLVFDNSDGMWSLGRPDGWEVFVERTEAWQRDLRGAYGDADCDGASLWLGRWVVQFDFGRKAAARAAERAARLAMDDKAEEDRPALPIVEAVA